MVEEIVAYKPLLIKEIKCRSLFGFMKEKKIYISINGEEGGGGG